MKITAEFEINSELENAFIQYIEECANGLPRHERKEMESEIEKCKHQFADDWSDEIKQELMLFILLQAGFQNIDGHCATNYEVARK